MCSRHEILTMNEKNNFFFRKFQIILKSKKAQSKQCSPMGALSSLKIFTLKMGTPCILLSLLMQLDVHTSNVSSSVLLPESSGLRH